MNDRPRRPCGAQRRINEEQRTMSEWEIAQSHPSEKLAKLHFFSVTKKQENGEIEFRIVVKEFVASGNPSMRYFAQADKQTNQSTAPFTPTGWGSDLLKALVECIRAIHRFPYEGPLPKDDGNEPSF
jgi:hypothetical protein